MNLKATLTLAALVLGLASVPAAYADQSEPAPVSEAETEGFGIDGYALGCAFSASNPYVSGGRMWTKLQIRCDIDRYLYWHARLTKDVVGPDKTVGSSDGYDFFPAGRTFTWYLTNNRDNCPGTGYFFGKLSIQASPLGTAFSHLSANVYIYSC